MSGNTLSTLTLGAVAIAAIGFAFLGNPGDVPIGERETIVVDGMGEVSVPHDYAAFNFAVRTTEDNPLDALQNNNLRMQNVIASLLDLGISDDDIQTSRVDLITLRNWVDPDDRSRGQIITYQASNEMRIMFTEVEGLGQAMSAVVEAGATDLNGPELFINDPETPLAEARNLAILDAIEMARGLAETADLSIGRILQVNDPAPDTWEQDDRYISRIGREDVFIITGSRIAEVPIQFGEEDVAAFVRVTFEIE